MRSLHTAGAASRWLIHLCLAGLFLGCGPRTEVRESVRQESSRDFPSYVILNEEQVRPSWGRLGCSGDNLGLAPSSRTPTEELVAELDPLIRRSLVSAYAARTERKVDPGNYIVQYFAVRYQGKEAVFANAIVRRLSGAGQGYDFIEHDILREFGISTPIFMCDADLIQFTMVIDSAGSVLRPLRFYPGFWGPRNGPSPH